MKKLVLSVLILLSSVMVFANDEKIFADIPGSYAIYHDLRFNDEAIIGLCYVGENSILARSYEPKTKNELMFLLEFVVNDSEIDLGPDIKLLKGMFNSSGAASRLLPMVMNWATSWYKSKDKILEKDRYSISTDDDFNYLSWIPVFQIETIGKKEEFTVFSIGRITNFSDERFFGITELPKEVKFESYKIKKGSDVDVVIDGLKIPLDSNWKTDDEIVYRLDKVTPQDGVFMVETLNYKESGFSSLRQLANLLLIGNSDVILLTDGSNIVFEKGSYFINYRMYDPAQKKVTVQQTQLIEREDGYVSIVSLACYEGLYLKNKKYFDKILH